MQAFLDLINSLYNMTWAFLTWYKLFSYLNTKCFRQHLLYTILRDSIFRRTELQQSYQFNIEFQQPSHWWHIWFHSQNKQCTTESWKSDSHFAPDTLSPLCAAIRLTSVLLPQSWYYDLSPRQCTLGLWVLFYSQCALCTSLVPTEMK